MTMLPEGLRVPDILAKTARVTLKDTLRVLAALDALAYQYNVDPADIVEQLVYDTSRPLPENVAACEQEFFALRRSTDADVVRLLAKIKELV